MKNLVHRLSDPRDPSYPFTDTYICSNCNERLNINDTKCNVCQLHIHGMVKKSSASNQARRKIIAPDYNTILTAKKSKSIKQDNSININADLNVAAKAIFKHSMILILVLGAMLAMLIAYDLNQNIVKSRDNYLETLINE